MNLIQRRLRNQYIAGPRLDDPGEVVKGLCAVQAQDYYASLWAIGLRLRGAREPDIERAISERRIVRTWPMRGTLHFVAAQDVRWMVELLAPRVLQRIKARMLRDYAIDAALIERASKTVRDALSGRRALTRPALYGRFEAEGIATDKSRGMHIISWLAQEGLICCGPRAGKQHTFVLLDEWVPPTPPIARHEALALLSRRYFAHHGPATLADFVWWSGLTVADARAALDATEPELVSETVGKTTWWSSHEVRTRKAEICHLLPVYDEYTVGYADRGALVDPKHATRLRAGDEFFRAPILIDGRIVGQWTREIKKDRVEIYVTALDRFTRNQLQAIAEAAERYAMFIGLAPKVIRT